MGVENKRGLPRTPETSTEVGKSSRIKSESIETCPKASIKRKHSTNNVEQADEVPSHRNEETIVHESLEPEYDLLGTIENENDSSDDDQEEDVDSDEEEVDSDEEGVESDEEEIDSDEDEDNETEGESEELSFEDDSEIELSDYESKDTSNTENDVVTQSGGQSTDSGFGRFTKTFLKLTSVPSSSGEHIDKPKETSFRESKEKSENESNISVSDLNEGVDESSVFIHNLEEGVESNNLINEETEGGIVTGNSVPKTRKMKRKKKLILKPGEETQPRVKENVKEKASLLDKMKSKSTKPKKVVCQEESESKEANEQVSLLDKIKMMAKPSDEYENDTSDEEDIRNTVGNIPMNWYNDETHIGYDWDGKKIAKPPSGDELDKFLKKMEDPNFWRTVKDPQTGQDVVLCDADVDLIARLQKHEVPDPDFNEHAPWIEWFTSEVMQMPVRKFPEHKRSFIPSKDEARKVSRMVHAIKMGWIKPKQEKSRDPQFYMLWETDDTAEHMRRIHNHIPAPKRHLPIHAESYNPPPEYLFDKREKQQWKGLKKTPWKRKVHFIPKKYASLREVPYYDRYIKERFLRCLDLYLCPRARKMRLLIQPEDLVPQLPSPKDLQPFPTTLALVYKGHTDMVRCITVEPKGQYLASGSDDLSVKIWEVATGRCLQTIPAGGIVRSVSWCPNIALSLLAVAADRKLLLINPGVGDILVVKKTDALLEEAPEQDVLVSDRVKGAVQWEQAAGEEWKKGIRIIINHFKEIKQVTWHGRGDYFASVMPEAQNRSVVIHQISKRRSQLPFNKSKGLVQCVLFHPIRPMFFVATQKNVRVYDLVKQEIVKKLLSNAKWISTMAVHPGGDNLLVATYDRKILWFDLDLSTKPYQTLRLHGGAVRGVAYHKRYPLFASGSDDNSVIVAHGMVYNDLLQNPLIVPVKRMSYHEKENDFSVFEVLFHPSQPWLFSSGADSTVRLYT